MIEGVLIPVRWGPDGEVAEVGLMTFDEAEYRIDPTLPEVPELHRYLRRHVRISGRTDGSRLVEIRRLQVMEQRGSNP